MKHGCSWFGLGSGAGLTFTGLQNMRVRLVHWLPKLQLPRRHDRVMIPPVPPSRRSFELLRASYTAAFPPRGGRRGSTAPRVSRPRPRIAISGDTY
jgi:hypothetical protein